MAPKKPDHSTDQWQSKTATKTATFASNLAKWQTVQKIILNKTYHSVIMSMSIKFFSVAKIAELLWCPQKCSRVTIQNQEIIVEKEMFLDVDGKQIGMEMTECQLAVSSIGVMQRPYVTFGMSSVQSTAKVWAVIGLTQCASLNVTTS